MSRSHEIWCIKHAPPFPDHTHLILSWLVQFGTFLLSESVAQAKQKCLNFFILFCLFQYFCRYANYYVQDNVLYRTLFKAYGIRFMILVYGQVKIIVACSVHHEVISFTENVLTPWLQTIFSLSPWSSLLYGLSF